MNNRDYQKMNETELKAYLHELVDTGTPPSWEYAMGTEMMTDEQSRSLYVGFRLIDIWEKSMGAKDAYLNLVKEFVHNRYGFMLVQYLLYACSVAAYKCREEEWHEVFSAFRAASTPFETP